MYECHGWVNVIESPGQSDAEVLVRLARRVELRIEEIGSENPFATLRVLNGRCHVQIEGYSNHRDPGAEALEEMFHWIAAIAPGSYGLLLIWDDENVEGSTNEFQVFAMARGRVMRRSDPYFSPCVPTIVDP
jgi:hypothetical protein